MNKFNPKLLVIIFAISFIIRSGYVIYEYNSDILVANAAETKEKTSKASTEQNNTPVKTVSDKILTPSNKQSKTPKLSSKMSNKINMNNNKDVCITGSMLKESLKQLEYLNQRETKIMEQQRLLEISDRRVREQVAKLKLIKEAIIKSKNLADSAINKESQRLISIYEKMKPKDAANIFNEMSSDVAAELLRTMKEDQSSQILSKMNPKNAYNVTLSLAGGIKKTKKNYNKINQN